MFKQLPLPDWYSPHNVGRIRQLDYISLSNSAYEWVDKYGVAPAWTDRSRVCVLAIDAQNTFCSPSGALFVGGRSGNAAVEDNTRACEFILRELGNITGIIATFDTHHAFQIFHPHMIVGRDGKHPAPYTTITVEDVLDGVWCMMGDTQRYLLSYVQTLEKTGRYNLTIWPYHAMLGSVGHALDSSIEEVLHFHTIVRGHQWTPIMKGEHSLTESYSAVGPEVPPINSTENNSKLLDVLATYDAIIVFGQAKSHCVAWTVRDLLHNLKDHQRLYLLEDCTSPVVTPAVDFTESAAKQFAEFEEAGAKLVQSTVPMSEWLER